MTRGPHIVPSGDGSGKCMENRWKMYGTCMKKYMEHVWKMYGEIYRKVTGHVWNIPSGNLSKCQLTIARERS